MLTSPTCEGRSLRIYSSQGVHISYVKVRVSKSDFIYCFCMTCAVVGFMQLLQWSLLWWLSTMKFNNVDDDDNVMTT
jgi:hypothetical protein